ncbi:MAG: glycosyltransferase family 39 protein, partial [Endomicrobiia bacterium]|nr:glycosyltransferase family 39 protein [Endomicrobiia bacterium]
MKPKSTYEILIVAAAALALFLAGSASFEAFDYDEAIYAATTAEMLRTKDFVAPAFNSKKFYEKPPLLYWMTAAVSNIPPFNDISRAGRTVAALSAAATTALVYAFAIFFFERGAARMSALVFATSLGTGAMARAILTDGPFAFFTAAALFAAVIYIDTGHRKFSAMFYASAALSMLAKGPAGPVIAGGAAFLYAIYIKKNILKAAAVLAEPAGIAVFFIIAAPWHIAAAAKTSGEFFADFFFVHNLGR